MGQDVGTVGRAVPWEPQENLSTAGLAGGPQGSTNGPRWKAQPKGAKKHG